MDCIALYDSGNYAYRVAKLFERRGLIFEVISTPCRISRTGCGYCLRFPERYMKSVIAESLAAGCPVREAYRIVVKDSRNNYIKIDLM